jgi:hypothetical protein
LKSHLPASSPKTRFCYKKHDNSQKMKPASQNSIILGSFGNWSFLACLYASIVYSSSAGPITLHLQSRDPASGEIRSTTETVDPSKVGVVVVDMWNWHWCKTSTMRVAALVPRMKHVLAAAHDMGMSIFWCPSDVVDNYVGTPQHEAAMNVKLLPLPKMDELNCPSAPDGGGCTCGKERCVVNYGWDGMHPDLQMYEGDTMPNDLETLYSLCKERGLTHIIYMGVHTQICLLGKSIGLRNMKRAGFHCILARDLTDAHGKYDPSAGITPDQFTAQVVAHFEKYLSPTINFADELRGAGKWNDHWIVDPVRVAPWGMPMRPHLFENEITVTLTTPGHPKAQIFYTTDDSEPTPSSSRYSTPLKCSKTMHLRAAAFEGDRPVCLPSEGYFARLGPIPPRPDVLLTSIIPQRAVGPGHSASSHDHRYSPLANPPQTNLSNRKQSLRLRGVEYKSGLGVQAPNEIIYKLAPEYRRFVALAGVDEHILEINNGSNLGKYPSVIFKIFIDGKLKAESPVMKITEQPWRFDVPVPAGSDHITLVASDAGDGNREDLANWVDAGFITTE